VRLKLARLNVAIVTVLVAGTLALAATVSPETRDWSSFGTVLVAAPFVVLFAVLGSLMVARQPQNIIGIGFCIATLVVAITAANELFLEYALTVADERPPGTATAAWISEWIWIPALVPVLTFLFLLSPDGRLPSRRWRPVAMAIAAAMTALLIGTMLSPFQTRPHVDNPYVFEELGRTPRVLMLIGLYALPPAIAVSATGMLVRFRRSRGVERQQLKWLTSSAALTGVLIVIAFVASPWLESDILFTVALFGGSVATASAIATSILRHRLYDIDVLINRTLVYGSLTAATVGSYVCIVAVMSWTARTIAGEHNNQVVVAATTLIVAALFQPARRRIQSLVDRHFYRSRYDAARIVEAFQSRLRDQTDVDTVGAVLAETVTQALQPASVGVWLRPGGERP